MKDDEQSLLARPGLPAVTGAGAGPIVAVGALGVIARARDTGLVQIPDR
ncbi:MAG: hypothetical protein M3324_03080 [Actinomycetota bacterium]|nr:hypothetical protein [Actinomycetota bacterium]